MERRKGLCVSILGAVVFAVGAGVLASSGVQYRAYNAILGAALASAGAALMYLGRRIRRRRLEDPAYCPELDAGLRDFAAARKAAAAGGNPESMDAPALGRIVFMQAKVQAQMLANSPVCAPPSHIGYMRCYAAAYAVNFSLSAAFLDRYLSAGRANAVMRLACDPLFDEYGVRICVSVQELAARMPDSLRRAGATEAGKRYPARAYELELTRFTARLLEGEPALFYQRALRTQVRRWIRQEYLPRDFRLCAPEKDEPALYREYIYST